MKKLTDQEIERAFFFWRKSYESESIDQELQPFLSDKIKAFEPNKPGWLKKTRQALFLSTLVVAERLKVTRSAYSRYEHSEETGSISLATLAKAAEAMDCELVYALRPKSKSPFSEVIWKKLFATAKNHPWLQKCDQKRRALALAAITKKLTSDPKFRRKQSWSQRANK